MAVDLPDRELVVAGRHRRVRSEDGVRGDDQLRFVEAAAASHERARALERAKGRVTLVHVPDGGHDAELSQRAHTADAEQQLLIDARVRVGRIQPLRQGAVVGGVLLQIRIKQIERDAADLCLPQVQIYRTAGQVDDDFDRSACVVLHLRNRQLLEIEGVVLRFLPAIFGDALAEIALQIQEADAGKWQAHVAGFLQMVTCQNAQAAGVHRQALVQAEFEGEIGDRAFVWVPRLVVLFEPGFCALVGGLHAHICVEIGDHAIVECQKTLVARCHTQALAMNLAQQLYRVVIDLLPQRSIEIAEHALRFRLPCPP